ncbi:CHAT domain-containing protein [Morchella snyderi]|nr:CHAT domain-containing protein [Morchella snyderi]
MEEPADNSQEPPTDDPGDAIMANVLQTLAQVGTLYNQFLATGSASILDEAIALAEELGAERISFNISGLEPLLLHMKQLRSGLINPSSMIEQDADSGERALSPTLPHVDATDAESHDLNFMLKNRYEHFDEVEDVDGSITLAEETLATTPIGHPDRPIVLNKLAGYLGQRYRLLGGVEDLKMAIMCLEEAVAAAPINHPDRPAILNNLGNHAMDRYERFGHLEDLERSIVQKQEAVEGTAIDHPDRPVMLISLSVSFNARHQRLGFLEDLERAITISEEAVAAVPGGYPHRGTILNTLACNLCDRYKRLGTLDDLQKAIKIGEQAVAITPAGHSKLPVRLNNLGNHLAYRYQRLGTLGDLEKAIARNEQAVEATPPSHPDLAGRLSNLGYGLRDMYERLGHLEDLEKAFRCSERAVEETPCDDPHRAGRLSGLANCFGLKYHRLGALEDLEMAIKLDTEVVESTPEAHSEWPTRLNNLASRLKNRFWPLGNLSDLDEAIELGIQALKATPANHPYRAGMLGNLSCSFHERYRQLEELEDLNQAIEWGERALRETPEDQPDRTGWLSNLGNFISYRYERSGVLRDIERAMELSRIALEATPTDHPKRASILNNLSIQLRTQNRRMRSLEDIDKAVEYSKQAYEAIPASHKLSATFMYNFADALRDRFDRRRDWQDLERAIKLLEGAVETLSPEHFHHSTMLQRLGFLLVLRGTGSTGELHYALDINLRSWNCKLLGPGLRVNAACCAAKIYYTLGKLKESCALYNDAVRLLPQISQRHLGRDDQQYRLLGFSELSSAAVSVALQAGSEVSYCLELLELSRGVSAGLSIDYRSSFSELQKQYPDIHKRFNILRNNIDSPMDYPRSDRINSFMENNECIGLDPRRQRETNIEEFEKLVISIRKLEGLGGFLLPPPAEDLMKLAGDGPIIILNCTSIRSDAILVTSSTTKVLPLPGLQFQETCRRIKQLSRKFTTGRISTYPSRNAGVEDLLLWLWDVAVGPIFEELKLAPVEDDSISLPRVWWIGVDSLSLLPFHAAGDHSPGSTRNTLCRAISSYTPTLKALSYAREKQVSLPSSDSRPRLLLIAMPETPGHAPLSTAYEEVTSIDTLTKEVATTEILNMPSAANVLERLSHCDTVHFTCHGVSVSKNPLQSHLVLCKNRGLEPNSGSIDKLTVEAISSISIKTAQIAFLPACSTARNDAYLLADESVHISSAFQLSGFSHVLATLWETVDRAPLQVSCDFYQHFFRDGHTSSGDTLTSSDGGHRKVSMAFHKAVKRLRDENWRQPLLWASFIHTGA